MLKSVSWVQTLALLLDSCVLLDKLLDLSGLSFPINKLGANIKYLTKLLQELGTFLVKYCRQST